MMTQATALIAEDEPLLARALEADLAQVWPELKVVAVAGDGRSAVALALQHLPDVLFFDIRMPGLDGLDAAAELAECWSSGAKPFPALVFVTAYDQHALQAFDAQAVDYLLKPVQPVRLKQAVAKIQRTLAARFRLPERHGTAGEQRFGEMDGVLLQLRQLLAWSCGEGSVGGRLARAAPLQHIQAGVGNTIRLVPVAEVVYFEAADKYVRVLTRQRDYLIRTPLKELLPQLDPKQFWQIHRGTVVNTAFFESVVRDEAGRLSVVLQGRPERLSVSRLYASLFRAM